MQYMEPSRRPEELLELMATPEQPARSRLYRPGFDHFMRLLPKVDAKSENPAEEVELTRRVMEVIANEVLRNIDTLDLPLIPDNEFGRVILAIEEPQQSDTELIPGTEVVLALWGKGFQSPVHGHAPGYIHEALLKGAFDVHLYEQTGDPMDRLVVPSRTIVQDRRETFYSMFVQDIGQVTRSALIHNFTARERSWSLHYLPEHVRDGRNNRFTVVQKPIIPSSTLPTNHHG